MYGSHLSIAGSLASALREAERLRMDTVQVFTKNQQQWRVPPLLPSVVREWTAELDRLGWRGRTVSHASYLINLASPSDELWEKSVGLMRAEIERCEALDIPFLVHHPGSPVGTGAENGIARIVAAYRRLMTETRGFRTVCCLENTVGAGTTLGGRFEELAALRARIAEATGEDGRIGFCFDTCHAHAAGYNFAARQSAEAVLDEFDRVCGLQHLRVIHVNDSKAPAGSRLDRHAHIGEGTIGRGGLRRSGFAAVVARAGLRDVPKILETPKGKAPSGIDFDALNLRRLRKLGAGPEPIKARRPGPRSVTVTIRRAPQAARI
ncbi:MAG: deoxyribonuclease IV [Phycisphaerales bacterium]